MLGNEPQNLILLSNLDRGKSLKHIQYIFSILDIPTRQLTNYKWVTQHITFVQVTSKFLVARTKMIYPHGCISKKHFNY